MERGFISLYRKLLDSQLFKHEKWLKVWVWCLLKSNHKAKSVTITTGKGKDVIKVQRGQFIFGRNIASKELDMPASTVRNIMDKLKNMGYLGLKKDTHCSIVTICNYSIYQERKQKKDTHKDTLRTGKGQPKDTTNNYNNENKEDSEDENVSTSSLSEEITAKDVIAKFCDLFKEKYEIKYSITSKDSGIAKRIAKNQDILILLDSFFASKDKFIVDNAHNFNIIESQINKLRVNGKPKDLWETPI